MTTTCTECNIPNAFGSCFLKATPCFVCQKLLCSKCAALYPLIPFDRTNDEANILTKNSKIESFCKQCFHKTSLIDYERTYDIITPTNTSSPPSDTSTSNANANKNNDIITFVIVHGGGGSRHMFRAQAETLANQYGYRSILIDLPGHGSLVDVQLTLDSCLKTITNVYEENQLNPKKTIYIGLSFGAYVGFYIMSKLSNHFIGAILLDCGQNVGPDASFKANAGIFVLRCVCQYMSNQQIMNSMVGLALKSPANYKLIETVFGCGMFFQQQGVAIVNCMHTVTPASYISQYKFPILFMNGSEDHRDSENIWLNLCTDQNKSNLIVYDGGDHFFTHDTRFVTDILLKIDTFVKSIIIDVS